MKPLLSCSLMRLKSGEHPIPGGVQCSNPARLRCERLLDWRAGARVPLLEGRAQLAVQDLGPYLKQQVSAARRPAHLLLQVRTQALNDELRTSFQRWYPGFGAQGQPPLAA